MDGTDFVEPGVGDGRFEGVNKAAATVGEDAEDAFEALLVEDEFEPAVGQRGFAGPIEGASGDHDVLVAEGGDRIDVGDFAGTRCRSARRSFLNHDRQSGLRRPGRCGSAVCRLQA